MENITDNPLYDKKIQDLLNKLISEEMLANMSYRNAIVSGFDIDKIIIDNIKILNKPFQLIANDELADHHKALVIFAIQNGYTVPIQDKEFKKYASDTAWKGYDQMKHGQDTMYYIDLMIELEKDAIKSYEDAMNIDDVPYELYSILQKNYYDECEHLSDLNTLKVATEAGAELAWTNSYEGIDDINDYWPYAYAYNNNGVC